MTCKIFIELSRGTRAPSCTHDQDHNNNDNDKVTPGQLTAELASPTIKCNTIKRLGLHEIAQKL